MATPQPSEEELFAEALRQPSIEAQATYLEAAIRNDEAQLQRLKALLKAHNEAGDFLEGQPVAVPRGTIVLDAGVMGDTEQLGDRIGRYKLLEQIGEGGCGVVYVAEQEEPVRRRVALKVIKLGMDTRQVVARFEAERQALAMMDHPNIAKVFDAGATETGRPYFVMELVRGIKITDYCDKNNLPTEERIRLFIQVCLAIQHAHQKGIIHRDIKPSNTLVTLHDGVPVPKVIDFGIAKATTDQRLTDKTVYTALEQFIGTPAYMSPEQAEMSGLDIDTRSDIYSLGVLLYELLTSRTPFDAKTLMKAGLDQMRRMIREQPPKRPSTRLSTLEDADLTSVAQKRQADAPKLIRLIRGDLDWIVMKTLEKDRTRRYETANGLAADLQRHLANEPVVARPPSQLYRVGKLVQRNKIAVATAAVVLLVLICGLAATSILLIEEREARRSAAAAEASEKALRLEGELKTLGKQAVDLQNRGALADAEAVLRKILAIKTEFYGGASSNVSVTLQSLGYVLELEQKYPESEIATRDALAIERKLSVDDTMTMGSLLYRLGFALERQNHLAEAVNALRDAVRIQTKFAGPADARVFWSAYTLARVLSRQGKATEAEKVRGENLKAFRAAAQTGNVTAQGELGRMYALGQAVTRNEREGLDWYRKCAEQRSKGAEGATALELNNYAWLLATCPLDEIRNGSNAIHYAEAAVRATNRKEALMLDTLAAAYAETGQFDKAITIQQEALGLLKTEEEKRADGYDVRLDLYKAKSPYRERGEF